MPAENHLKRFDGDPDLRARIDEAHARAEAARAALEQPSDTSQPLSSTNEAALMILDFDCAVAFENAVKEHAVRHGLKVTAENDKFIHSAEGGVAAYCTQLLASGADDWPEEVNPSRRLREGLANVRAEITIRAERGRAYRGERKWLAARERQWEDAMRTAGLSSEGLESVKSSGFLDRLFRT